MIGTLKLAGIAVLAVGVAGALGYLRGHSNGYASGYDKKTKEIAAATKRVNNENDKLGQVAKDAIRKDQERQDRVRVINKSKMQCIVTKEFAQRFAQ